LVEGEKADLVGERRAGEIMSSPKQNADPVTVVKQSFERSVDLRWEGLPQRSEGDFIRGSSTGV
jgi:hypothetical protein